MRIARLASLPILFFAFQFSAAVWAQEMVFPSQSEIDPDPANVAAWEKLAIRGQKLGKRVSDIIEERRNFDAAYANLEKTPALIQLKGDIERRITAINLEMGQFKRDLGNIRRKPNVTATQKNSPPIATQSQPNAPAPAPQYNAVSEALTKMQTDIDKYASELKASPSRIKGELNFDKLPDEADAFGTRKAAPKLGFPDPKSEESESMKNRLGFDDPGALNKNGAIPKPPEPQAVPLTKDALVIPERLRQDPDVKKLSEYQSQVPEASAAAAAARAKVEEERKKDPNSKELITLEMNARNAEDKVGTINLQLHYLTSEVKRKIDAETPAAKTP